MAPSTPSPIPGRRPKVSASTSTPAPWGEIIPAFGVWARPPIVCCPPLTVSYDTASKCKIFASVCVEKYHELIVVFVVFVGRRRLCHRHLRRRRRCHHHRHRRHHCCRRSRRIISTTTHPCPPPRHPLIVLLGPPVVAAAS